MTTGTRLKKTKSKIIPLLLSATMWCAFGTGFGWHFGNLGGFKRGVQLTANLFVDLMDARDSLTPAMRKKYTDI